ncbi:DEAD/DEAH box helicase family protein [Streptomyces sp. NPDC049915]|uniref:DEAD/DEAH box helicase family protein n=1 Tax=Streptomyces sp. NPDC049915 TaxID=3155510 RepID=UPI0034431C55
MDKLERAEFLLSQGRDDLQRHVDALREVQPEPLPPEDIKAKLGAPWIPVEDVTAFAQEMLGVRVDIIHVAKTATWNVDMPMTIPEAATSEWGTSRVNAFELLDLALNGQAPKVYDTFRTADGGSLRVRNDKETMLAESKMTALMRRFASWVWEDPDRAERLATDYNRIFNSTVLPKHDGSHLTVDGMHPEFKPYEHQWDFVQRVLSAEEGSLCPYPVGAGKTATMFMTAVKLKQLGLVNKPMIVVPNHLLEQISRDGKKLFPNAKILMAGKKDLADARSRMLFAARCATGDWDAIVMTHNSFGRLGVHPVTEATYLEELANEYRVALSAIDGDGANQRRIKEIAKMVDRYDARASDHAMCPWRMEQRLLCPLVQQPLRVSPWPPATGVPETQGDPGAHPPRVDYACALKRLPQTVDPAAGDPAAPPPLGRRRVRRGRRDRSRPGVRRVLRRPPRASHGRRQRPPLSRATSTPTSTTSSGAMRGVTEIRARGAAE